MYSLNCTIRLFLTFSIFIFINACHKPNDDAPDGKEYVVTEIKYDNIPNGTKYYYNDHWQLIEKTESVQTEPKKIEHIKYNYTYNSDGLVSREEISREMATYMYVGLREMDYDTNGRLVRVSEYGKGTNTLLYSSEYEYNDKIIIKKLYANSIPMFTCTYTLDGNGNIVKAVTHSFGGMPDLVEEWLDYDDKQNLLGPVAGNVRSKNNPLRYIRHATEDAKTSETITMYSYKNNKYVDRIIKMGPDIFSKSGNATITWVVKQ